jgi:integrase
MRLTSKRVLNARKRPGRYPDGHGLYLQVTSGNAASWVLRFERAGRERMLGLGPLHTVGLKEARERAKAARLQLLDGVDPVAARKQAKAARALEAAKSVTFQECAESYFEAHESKWRNAKHRQQFINSLRTYAFPVIGKLPVAAIDTGLVLKVIEPIWRTIPETSNRLRSRLEMVLDFATVRNLRTGDNPARWSGHIEHLLPRRAATSIAHYPALPYAEVPSFMQELRKRKDVPARALEFAILTAARSSEVLNATWDEVDQSNVWTIPGARMKGGTPHRVPLAPQAVALLKKLPREADNPYIFIGARPGKPLSTNVLQKALARIRDDVTVHGFRSTFRDWGGERTAFPFEVLEKALAHTVGNKSSRSYARSDLLAERAKLMEAWATYCYTPAAEGAVVPMRAHP